MPLLPKRLAPRLILALTLLVAVVTGVSAVINVQSQRDQLLHEKALAIDHLSRSLTSAVWQAMLVDQREAAYEVMEAVGQNEGIESIRIFNKDGQVTFSTDLHAPRQVDVRAEACFLCHAVEQPLVRVDVATRARIFRGRDGQRLMGMVTPFYNESSCSEAGCHAHPAEKSVLGVLDIAVPLDQVDAQVVSIERRALASSLVEIALMAALIGVLTRQLVGKPIQSLIVGTKAISAHDLDQPIEIHTDGEIGELGQSFQHMRQELKRTQDELDRLMSQLEEKVAERSRQLDQARHQLIVSDRLATLGQLAATVAHEINNPVAGVLNLAMLMERLLDADGIPPARVEDFRHYLQSTTEEMVRIGRIVSDLLTFSRHSAPRRLEADINEVVRHTVSLVTHKLELEDVSLATDLGQGLPSLLCDRSQLQQVIVNLIMNAAEASSAGDIVTVATSHDRERDVLILRVEDRGSGISPEHVDAIYDPFFTTKPAGHGVGLGLSVVHGIVSAHGGSISVESREGRGSVFTVAIPRQTPDQDEPIPEE